MASEDAFAGDIQGPPWRIGCAAAIVMGLLVACRDGSSARVQSIGDAGWFADGSVRTDAAAREDPTFHHRCDVRNRDPRSQVTLVEKHDYIYWFCSPQLELEVMAEPIEIIEDDDCCEEFSQWKLSVGGVPVHVRLDGDSTDLVAHGWRESEIESVVYPEAYGRSARRVHGNEVKRETDLILNGNSVWHVHLRYEARYNEARYEAVPDARGAREGASTRMMHIDQMIDRVHVPICLRSAGCKQ
jgi:hypothetical protein